MIVVAVIPKYISFVVVDSGVFVNDSACVDTRNQLGKRRQEFGKPSCACGDDGVSVCLDTVMSNQIYKLSQNIVIIGQSQI